MSHIAVVIVSYNSWDVLPRCLASLACQTYTDFSITVVDNASPQLPPPELLAAYPSVLLVQSSTNLGFAAANNLAVAQHTGTSAWIALLNPDAFPEPDWLAQLMQAAAAHPECSVFASRQVSASHPHLLDGDGDIYYASGRVRRAGHGTPVPSGPLPAIAPVFGPCAASAMYQRSAFVAVGGLDEDFFCYLEDVDLSFRLQLAGYGCLLVRSAVVHHLGASSTDGPHSDFAVYYGHRNLVWTFVKNMPGPLLWLLLPLHLALNVFTILVYIRRPGVILRAKTDAIKGLPFVWSKRKSTQTNRIVSIAAVWQRLGQHTTTL